MDKFWEWMEEKYNVYYGTNITNKWMFKYDANNHLINAVATKQMLIGYMIEYLVKDYPKTLKKILHVGNDINNLYKGLVREIKIETKRETC